MGTSLCSRSVACIVAIVKNIIIISYLIANSQDESENVENDDFYSVLHTKSPQYYDAEYYSTKGPGISEVYNQEIFRNVKKAHTVEPGLWKNYRLPSTLSPQYYNITLWPRLEMDSNNMYIFTGQSGVAFTCVKETDLILIHSNKLSYSLTPDGHHAKLTGLEGAKAPGIKKTWIKVETQYLVVQLRENLQVGETYWLYTEFQGELANDLSGFYRTSYFEDGVKKIIATTKMKPTDARMVFPCFDEPAMKAVFHMTVIHPPGTVALFNSMENGTEMITMKNQTVLQTNFEPTEKMSTYLLGLVVSNFDNITTGEKSEVLVRVWGRRQALKAGHGDYALNITGRILDFFQNYYNSTYPMPKSDHVALPYFKAVSMDNWGLITYKEKGFLYDPIMSSNEDKESVTVIIAHEVAHMWFGNLVTMKWWNDLWLNEGFATYVSYLGVNDVQPTWNMKDLMVLNEIHEAFEADALASSRPLSLPEEEVRTPVDILKQFAHYLITYKKGGAVLRMLSEFLSEPVFARGLSAYLKQFAHCNTENTDLWGKLQEVVSSDPGISLPANVSEIMDRWVLQMGFPVVTIDTRTGNITQNHFLSHADSEPDRTSVYNYEWYVPITWMKNGTVMDRYWLLEKNATHFPMKTNSEWVLANVNVSGFYRVNYDSQNWQRLLSQLSTDHSVIPVINRAQIVDDAFNLAWANVINISVALSTTRYLSEEREYIPWKCVIKNLDNFFDKFHQTEVYDKMQEYMRRKVQPLFYYFKNITANWTKVPSSHTDQYHQVNAIILACTTGVEDCVSLTKMWYQQWMKNPDKNPINPSLRKTVYCNAIAAGGVSEWLFAWNEYKRSSDSKEAERLLYALSCTRYSWILKLYLGYTLNPIMVPMEKVICHVADNKVGRLLVWDFIRENWKHIYLVHGERSFMASVFCGTKTLVSSFEIFQLRLFKSDIMKAGYMHAAMVVDMAITLHKANMMRLWEHSKEVRRWLAEELA